ncbi:MAG TPA: KamA family radical SAM protein [Gemmatimonadaceae bacterium]|jgi:lysine 2,3-aminomutase|nr:KamA family radical SAM protein [Gemmatimonadaceae bacterium]
MSDWQQILHQSADTLDKLADRFGRDAIDVEALKPAFDNFQVRLTPAALESIREVGDPMWNQYVPSVQELDVRDGVIDSLDEDGDSPVPNITHRYPDRVLFLVSPVCATYCRFCTRRRKVGDPEKIPLNQYDSAFEYIRAHPEVRDVILSGGDPMMLSDRRLEYIFQRLREIPHVEIIRIGSRITSHLPERITPEFCEMVKKYHPIYMNTHFNHPAELTPATVAALGRLADAGVPLGCQTVILRGVNDTPEVIKELMQKLLKARVRPYYLYMADQVAGGEHFRTTVETGLEIVKALRGWTSGLAVPHFCIDAPGGGGKVPLLPEYVEKITDDEVIFRNYEGKRFTYKQPRQPAATGAAAAQGDPGVVPIQVAKKRGRKAARPRRRTGSD